MIFHSRIIKSWWCNDDVIQSWFLQDGVFDFRRFEWQLFTLAGYNLVQSMIHDIQLGIFGCLRTFCRVFGLSHPAHRSVLCIAEKSYGVIVMIWLWRRCSELTISMVSDLSAANENAWKFILKNPSSWPPWNGAREFAQTNSA